MNKKCNRLDFIKSASLLPVTAGLGLGTGSAAALQPIKRAGGSALKVSCNAYSFAKLLNSQLQERGPGISLFDLAEFCAKQNFDGVDLTGYYFPGYEKNGPGVPADKYLPIETLSPRGGGGGYDPYKVVPKFLAELRQAIAQTA
jgi:hypothetical protein